MLLRTRPGQEYLQITISALRAFERDTLFFLPSSPDTEGGLCELGYKSFAKCSPEEEGEKDAPSPSP